MKKTIALICLLVMLLASGSGCAPSAANTSGTSSASTTGASTNASDTTASQSVTIEERVLLDWNGVKVTAKKYVEDPIWGDGIQVLVENNSGKSYGIGCKTLIVNDYMISDLFSVTVAPGKKDNETLHLSSSALAAAGITNVGKIEIYLHVFDSESYLTLHEAEGITIETSAFDRMDTTPADIGTELYSKDGVRILGKYVDEESFWGSAVLLYLENNSGQSITVQCEDMSVNGFMVTPLLSCTVFNNKMAVTEIPILSADLEENGIEKVAEIELRFDILDSESFQTIATSGPISLKA